MADVDRAAATLIAYAEKQGWRVEFTTNGHYKCFAPDSDKIVVTGGTSSDWRSFKNFAAQMARAGLRLPEKSRKKVERYPTSAGFRAQIKDIPWRDINAMPPYPIVFAILGQWRSRNWFNSDLFPVTEDEAELPSDQDLFAAVLLDAPAVDSRSDRVLMTQFYGLKLWASDSEHQWDQVDCECGKRFLTGGSLALATHIYKDWEAVGSASKCAPANLLPWENPDELREAMQPDERDEKIERLNARYEMASKTIEDQRKRIEQAKRALG